jgi:hypothetical protein
MTDLSQSFDRPSLQDRSSRNKEHHFQDLNGFRYQDHWLRNLMIAASLNGHGTGKANKHKLI